MTDVGVCGYGTIGKRVADAVAAQPDLTLVGAAKRSPNAEAKAGARAGIDLYAAAGEERFEGSGIEVAGDLEDLIVASDVMVDATPSGVGAQNRETYEAHDTPAILQGGESADAVEVSFNARANYGEARDAEYVRVVSCNSTGLSRILAPLSEEYGVEDVTAVMVRRGGDPAQSGRGPIDDILPDPITIPSHHGPDVETVFPDLDVTTIGLKVPATLMHVQCLEVDLGADATAEDVRGTLDAEARIELLPGGLGIDGCGAVKELAKDVGRPRADFWENAVWAESITVEDGTCYLIQGIHQESNVVPENVDAIRAIAGSASAEESMARTEETLGIGIWD